MRARSLAAVVITWAANVHAMGPPAMVHTKDGSVYYGELVERVEKAGDAHVTILLATGIPKRIPLAEIDATPIEPIVPMPPREERRPPTITVRTLNGSAYHGELIERVVGEHVVLKLETGEVKTLDWADLDASPPPAPRSAPRELAPMENVRTKNGSIYHGEIIEKVVRDHVTLKLATDEIKTIDWVDLQIEPPPRPQRVAADTREAVLRFGADDPNATLERRTLAGSFIAVCHGPCEEPSPEGTYRIVGAGLLPTDPFTLGGHDATVSGLMSKSLVKRIGVITSIASAPVLLGGFILMVASISAPGYSYAIGQYGYPQSIRNDNSALGAANAVVNVVGVLALLTGAVLMTSSHSHARVNGVVF